MSKSKGRSGDEESRGVTRVKQMTHSHHKAFSMEDLLGYYDKLLKSDIAKDVGLKPRIMSGGIRAKDARNHCLT
jgi:hypothetical protein